MMGELSIIKNYLDRFEPAKNKSKTKVASLIKPD